MAESRFVYVTFIRATPEAIWAALTDPEANKKFWSGYSQVSRWKVGAPYELTSADGEVWDAGEVLAVDAPRLLSVSWAHQKQEDLKAEGVSTATFTLEPQEGGVTKLTLTHTIAASPSKFIDKVSNGWPSILSSLKSLLETGEALR